MGAFLEKPNTEKLTYSGSGHGLQYGLAAMQGWRKEMEDQHVCNMSFKLEDHSFFGVFDGHAGAAASEYCSEHMLDTILKCYESDKKGGLDKAIQDGFLKLDEELSQTEKFAGNLNRGGTTAVTVMVTPTQIIWGNCGDSRGIYCRDSKLFFNTEDHKPLNEKEKARIEKAGGTVMMQRVNGSLAVSRAIGDFEFKADKGIPPSEQLVSPVPEVTVIDRDQDKDHWLFLACDGIYDVLSNEEIVTHINRQLQLTKDLKKICSDLLDWCLNKNSKDNMSVILITFKNVPGISPALQAEEEELQELAREYIDKHIQELGKTAQDALDLDEAAVLDSLPSFLTTMTEEDKEKFKPMECFDFTKKKNYISEKAADMRKEKFKEDLVTDDHFSPDYTMPESGGSNQAFGGEEFSAAPDIHTIAEFKNTCDS